MCSFLAFEVLDLDGSELRTLTAAGAAASQQERGEADRKGGPVPPGSGTHPLCYASPGPWVGSHKFGAAPCGRMAVSAAHRAQTLPRAHSRQRFTLWDSSPADPH